MGQWKKSTSNRATVLLQGMGMLTGVATEKLGKKCLSLFLLASFLEVTEPLQLKFQKPALRHGKFQF